MDANGFRIFRHRMLCRVGALLLTLAFALHVGPAGAQAPLLPTPSVGGETVPEIPAELTLEQVDSLLAQLTDADIRKLLADELRQRATEQTVDGMSTSEILEHIRTRFGEMSTAISQRVPRWINGVLNIRDRDEEVAKRLNSGSNGVQGILIGITLIVLTGFGVAFAVSLLTIPWRRWLCTIGRRSGYWDRVIRSLLLGILEILPIMAFGLATQFAVPFTSDMLGRIGGYFTWIYPAGISYCWFAVVIARRVFSPEDPKLRIAPVNNRIADYDYRTIRRAALTGAGAWLMAGLFLQTGLGWGPALLTMATGGTVVAGILLYAILTRFDVIRASVSALAGKGTFGRVATASAPWLATGYVIIAWLFWLTHFLETGAQHLFGPVGTLIVLIVLPIFDRLGQEIIHSLLRYETPISKRFRAVCHSGWRVLVGICAMGVILYLWTPDLFLALQGPATPGWFETLRDMIVTLLIVWFIWRLIKAALHQERKFVAAGESFDPLAAPAATRMDTLMPLFRGMLLAFVAAIGLMFGLSSLGVDIGPLLASAGIIGIAVGFGAQALVRDIFSGMFFLIDDAFRVGDYIELTTELRGDVETISIRSLQLRHHRGPVITIPFGEMKNITNHTRDWVLYKMPFRMEPDTNPDKFKKIVKTIGKEFSEHPEHGPKFLEPLKSQGVYFVDDDSALVFRVKFKCKPRAQFVLRREIYHRLRQAFDAEGFRLARRKVEVVSSGGDEEIGLPDDILTSES